MKFEEINNLVAENIEDIGLIRKYYNKSVTILGDKAEKKQRIDYFLQKVEIENLTGENWIFEAEYNNLKANKCLKNPSSKTVERCILHLSDSRLYVFMIELKSQINECRKLRNVKDKFVCTLTNLSILLSGNTNFQQFKDKELFPVGILVFNKEEFDISKTGKSDICKKFKEYKEHEKESRYYLISIEPVTLNKMTIPIVFYQNNHYQRENSGNSNSLQLDFKDILEIKL